MRKIFSNTLLFLSLLFWAPQVIGQSENAVALSSYSLDEDQETVRVSIKTSESFIVGANRYVLHVGSKHFLLNEHPDGSLSEIVFLLPLSDYQALEDQSGVVLVYGYYHQNTLQDGEGGEATGFVGKHWKLGKFTLQNLNSK